MQKQEFDVINVRLEDTNLIEASAGTGKTYSIALLVIRLIVERFIRIEEILMVTFTNAAVAELESRVRKLINQAHVYCDDDDQTELTADMQDMQKILDKAILKTGKDEVKDLLFQALLSLDETAIFTIHSFCQRTLNEFAFETDQSFENEIAADISPFVDEAVKIYWRQYITTLDVDMLYFLIKHHFDLAGLKKQVDNYYRSGADISYSDE